jgi:hypothetical protein
MRIYGDLEDIFRLKPTEYGSMGPLWTALEHYSLEATQNLTVYKSKAKGDAIWLHPGEPFFDRFREAICTRFGKDAIRGAVFIDPTSRQPYLFHFALIRILRKADKFDKALSKEEILEYRLVGLKYDQHGTPVQCPVEHLLLLRKGNGIPAQFLSFAAIADTSRDEAKKYAEKEIARVLAEKHRDGLMKDMPEREQFIRKGFDHEAAELAAARTRLTARLREGDQNVKGELTRIKNRQRDLTLRREEELAYLFREPDLVTPEEVVFLAHALVIPSEDAEEKKRFSQEIEQIAVQVVWAYEETQGANVRDVSRPELSRSTGLEDWCGFDLLSRRPSGEERAIEVKGRAGIGDVELHENEWAKACTLRDRYWLYVVYECASASPRLLRVQDPFKLLVRAKGGVIIDEKEIFGAAEV